MTAVSLVRTYWSAIVWSADEFEIVEKQFSVIQIKIIKEAD
jgi:hypothetical protein